SLSDSRIQVFRKQLNSSEPMPLIKQWDQIGQNYLKAWEPVAMQGANVQKAMDQLNSQTEQLLNK
ncbi:MAG: ABC transporter substrate-binding protein, partial [Schleiferilactobacillus harbinensis]